MYYQQQQNNQNQYFVDQNQGQKQNYYNQYNSYQPMDTGYDKYQSNNVAYDFDLGDFADSMVRGSFVKKVYFLLTFELAFTLMMIALAMYTDMQFWLISSVYEGYVVFCSWGTCIADEALFFNYTWVFWTSMILAFILQIVLYCGQNIARKVPINYILTLFYLFFFGMFIAGLCLIAAFYAGYVVIWQAWGIVFAIVLGLTTYACVSSTDFTFKIGAIFVLIPVLFILIMMTCFYPTNFLYIFICSIIVIIYGFFLIWETQMILGKGKIKFSIDDYMIASLMLYGTIIQLFLRILEILVILRGGRR